MPIYEFKCYDCGRVFEKLCFTKEDEKDVKCPYCGSKDVEKIISAFSGIFGTSGFGFGGGSSCGGGSRFGIG
jgi:putative FmdB family regulatory protein